MAIKNKNRNGTTLVELMITVGIIGTFVMIAPNLMTNMFRLWKTSEARVDVQRDARITLGLVQGLLRHASANSITITRETANDPPYSKIIFTNQNSHTFQFYQSGNNLWFYHQDASGIEHHRILVKNLRYITFGFPQITEDSLLSVAICFEKSTYGGDTKDFYLSTQRVQVMNI